MIRQLGYLCSPILIHFLCLNLGGMITSFTGDTTFMTGAGNLLALPFVVYMLRQDDCKISEKKISSWWYLLSAIGGIGLNLILTKLMDLVALNEQFSDGAQSALFSSGLILQLLILGILVPIVEELVFRGLFYNRIRQFVSIPVAVFLGASIFGIYHGNVIQGVFSFCIGFYLIYCYEKTRDLKIPILIHAAINVSSILLNWLFLK